MKLFYYKGNNFGDQLNPILFNKLLPNFFNEDNDELFLGIGSILGFDAYKSASKKYIFSSGIGKGKSKEYGSMPIIDDSYKFLCVRGPLTAKILKIDPALSITDGAALINELELPQYEKEYEFTFIPHKNTVYKFNWAPLCRFAGIKYVSPQDGFYNVLKAIIKSRVVMAESLHAAIVADALRIPWIPFKTFYSIDAFKWEDWALSVELPYMPFSIFPLVNEEKLAQLLPNYLKISGMSKLITKSYTLFQKGVVVPKAINQLEKLKHHTQFLSENKVLSTRVEQLLEKIHEFKSMSKLL